jgi:DNA-binding transcriptional LysR family regulator
LFRDELMFVFAASHPWAAGRPINREDMRRQPFILYRNSSITAYLTDEFFRKLDFEPATTMEVGSIEAIKELVKLNLGVSVLAPWTVERELGQGSLRMRPLGTKPLTRQWVVASHVGRRLSLAEETFYRLCRKQTASMRLDRKDVPALSK